MIEERLQRLAQGHDPRDVVLVEDVQVQRDPAFQVGLPEQALHQHVGIDVTALRLQHQPDVDRRFVADVVQQRQRSEEHTSELQSLMRISYAVFCLKKKKNIISIQVDNIR